MVQVQPEFTASYLVNGKSPGAELGSASYKSSRTLLSVLRPVMFRLVRVVSWMMIMALPCALLDGRSWLPD